MEKFYLEKPMTVGVTSQWTFEGLCKAVKDQFMEQWKEDSRLRSSLEIQKKAIIGYENEVRYFQENIRKIVGELKGTGTAFPGWYTGLTEGIYHENWGLCGIAEWFSETFRHSSSAKIIGERIYFLEQGKMVLKPQKITYDRREQLLRAFLLLTPKERLNKDFHEIYMLDGTRITVFRGDLAKKNQDVIIFRRYIVPQYRFTEQVKRHTIPKDAVPLFEAMVKIGFNVAFTGAVRTAKSTFLSTWQSYEDPLLEGVMVETDPEIPLHQLMPQAPIVQLIADNEKLSAITKNLLRSDADYFILAEARDGNAMDTAVRIAAKGTKRMKITFHTKDPLSFPLDVALEILKERGGELEWTMKKVAASFDYIFHFVQLKDKSQKRLKSIYELSLDSKTKEISMVPICQYCYSSDDWRWTNHIGEEKRLYALEENEDAYLLFADCLESLASASAPETESKPDEHMTVSGEQSGQHRAQKAENGLEPEAKSERDASHERRTPC